MGAGLSHSGQNGAAPFVFGSWLAHVHDEHEIEEQWDERLQKLVEYKQSLYAPTCGMQRLFVFYQL